MKKIILTIATITTLIACNRKEGCTDPKAFNYDQEAKKENNTCTYCDERCGNVLNDAIINNQFTLTVQNSCSNNIQTFTVAEATWWNYSINEEFCNHASW